MKYGFVIIAMILLVLVSGCSEKGYILIKKNTTTTIYNSSVVNITNDIVNNFTVENNFTINYNYSQNITPNSYNCTGSDLLHGVGINETGGLSGSCQASTSSSTNWGVNPPYIFNNSNNIDWNESYGNQTYETVARFLLENSSIWSSLNTKLIDLITTLSSYLLISGSTNKTIDFNESRMNTTINNVVASITYYPTQYYTKYGTESGGNNLGNLSFYDDQSFNITEASGVNALEFYVNFTGVTTFNNILIREYYLGSTSHNIQIEIYDYTTTTWESYADFIGQTGFNVLSIPVLDPSVHINNSLVQIRFRHIQNGINTHKLFIDYVQLVKGFSALTNIQHDALSGRDSPNNHPQYLLINGNRTMTGNLNMGNYNITNISVINVSTIFKNVTRYPSGSCEYDNGTAVLFRNPCNI